MSEQSIFHKYGGFGTVSKLVHNFYDKVMDTPSLQPYFVGVNMNRLVQHQTDFLAQVLGGPANYSGAQLAEAHKHLKITSEDFDMVAELLEETCEEAGVEDDDVKAILALVASTKEQIVTA